MRNMFENARKLALRGAALLSFLLAGLVVAPPAMAKFYVNAALGDVKPEAKVTVAEPKPVQLIFTFQTNGKLNGRATKYAKPIMIEDMKKLGVFADFVETPTADGALLSIDFNNIPEKGAAGKGFATGFTFGLKGLFVTDFYEVTFKYVPANGKPVITKLIKHALHLKKGNKEVESPGILVKNADAAVRMVIAQVSAHGLNDLASDPGFGQALKSAMAAPAPAQ